MDNEQTKNNSEQINDVYIFEEENESGEPMNFVTRFISIFAAPGRLMENLVEFPRRAAPFLYILILGIVTALMAVQLTPIITNAQSIAIAERYGMDFLNMTQASEAIEQGFIMVFLTGWAATVFSFIIGAAISAAALVLVTKLLRGNASFKHYFALNLHRSTLISVGSIITSAIMLLTQSFMSFTSLAPVFMPNGNNLMPMFNLLTAIELFGIWSVILLIIGLKKLNDSFSGVKAVVVGLIWYALGVAFTVGASSVSMIMLDMSYNAIQQMR